MTVRLTDSPAITGVNEEEREFLEGIATRLIQMLSETEKAMADLYYRTHLDQDEMLEVWGQLPAKVRTAINRGNGK